MVETLGADVTITLADVRTYLAMDAINDTALQPHFESAKRRYESTLFSSEAGGVEAIACMTIYYASPMMWLKIQRSLNEAEESFDSFRDVERFQEYWEERAGNVATVSPAGSGNSGAISMIAI